MYPADVPVTNIGLHMKHHIITPTPKNGHVKHWQRKDTVGLHAGSFIITNNNDRQQRVYF